MNPEDQKLITLARSARARAGARRGAAVRDGDGRTYAAASVELPSLRLSALQLAVAMAVSSGAPGLEAAVVLGEDASDPEGEAAVHDVAPNAPVLRAGPDGTVITEPQQREHRVRQLYAAFNRRDIDMVLAGLARDVVWANGMDGGYVHGQDGVRAYWTRQFEQIRSTVEPLQLRQQPDGRMTVEVHQVVCSADGSQRLAEATVRHVFTFDGAGLVSRFDID